MIRVYLDTNVLVMGILKKDSNSRTVLDLVSEAPKRLLENMGMRTFDSDL